MFFNYQDFYAQVAARADFKTFVELGVYAGDSLAFLHSELEKRGTPYTLCGIDLWEEGYARTGYHRHLPQGLRQMVEKRFEDAKSVFLVQDESAAAASRFTDQSVDFVFIDANHSEEFVTRDIAAWLPKVRPGGMISGHDFREPCGVEAAVVKAFGEGNFSVIGTVWHKTV